MRNLKKILAMVLALIMSLSLMSIAGATDFPDDENISDTYRQAAEVLSDLGVFNGDQNGNFNPKDPIRRSEVAAIIYRIATGDVKNTNNDTFTPYNQFSDVVAGDWFAGYVTFCANAGYIKGRGDGTFDPYANVTGYEVLAMILRAVGYDKNNEFVGPDWQLHTASLAQQMGVLKNITNATSTQLSEAATRETVAEMLFRSILLPQVTFSTATLSYNSNGVTLAKEHLDTERLEGVIIANEYADLEGATPIKAGTTRMKTESGSKDLTITTGLEILGERRWAYVQGGTRILGSLENPGNNVKDNEGARVKSLSAWAGMNLKGATHLVNFDEATEYTSDILIRYNIDLTQLIADKSKFHYLLTTDGKSTSALLTADNTTAELSAAFVLENGVNRVGEDTITVNNGHLFYNRIIHIGDEVTPLDQDLIYEIFDNARGQYNGSTVTREFGSVMVGTQHTDDLSDSRDWTYRRFVDEILNPDTKREITSAGNGEWLKVIDHNNDGVAEYVLLTKYNLAEIDGYNTRTELWSFSDELNTDLNTANSYKAVFLGTAEADYEPAEGDVVVYSLVDGQALIRKAASVEDSVVKYNYENRTNVEESIDTAAGENYKCSDITNGTLLGDQLKALPNNTPYILYFDEFGYVRAYEPVDSDKHYGLLTEVYGTSHQNSLLVTDNRYTAELSIPVEGSNRVDTQEYNMTAGNEFIGIPQVISNGINPLYNGLQRAIAHLGVAGRSNNIWNDGRTNGNLLTNGTTALGSEFDWDKTADGGVYNNNTTRWSATNIAKYAIDGKNAALSTAASYAYDRNNQPLYYADLYNYRTGAAGADGNFERYTEAEFRTEYAKINNVATDSAAANLAFNALTRVYETDYVMLDEATGIAAGQREYDVDSTDPSNGVMDNKLFAVDDTEYYIVTVNTAGRPTGVSHFTGYRNLPAISANRRDGSAADNIRAVYAVGQNTRNNAAGSDYWVADVIVVEVLDTGYANYDKMVLVYNDNNRRFRTTDHSMTAIDCDTGKIVTVNVTDNWDDYNTPGFYALYGVEVDGDVVTASSSIKLESSTSAINQLGRYVENNIVAGRATYVNTTLDRRSDYLTVEKFNDNTTTQVVMGKDVPWYTIWSSTGANQTLRCDLMSKPDYDGNRALGHELIWVTDGKGNVVFVVDTTFVDPNWTKSAYVPANFLTGANGLYATIRAEQDAGYVGQNGINVIATLDGKIVGNTAGTDVIKANTPSAGYTTIDKSEIDTSGMSALTGYSIAGLRIHSSTKRGAYSSAVVDANGDLVIYGVTGTVVVEAIMTHTSNTGTLTIAQGSNATIAANGSMLNGKTEDTLPTSKASVPQGTEISFQFTTASTATGLYDVALTTAGTTTTYQATKVGTSGNTTTWSGTYYMPQDTVTITVKGDVGTYRNVTVNSGFELTVKPAIKNGDTLTTMNVRAAAGTDMTGKSYDATVAMAGADLRKVTEAGAVLTANQYKVDPNGTITFGTGTVVTGDITITVSAVTKKLNVTVNTNNVATTSTVPATVDYNGSFSFTITPVGEWTNIKLAAGTTADVVTLKDNVVSVKNAKTDIVINLEGSLAANLLSAAVAKLNADLAAEIADLKVTSSLDAQNQVANKANTLLGKDYPGVTVKKAEFSTTVGEGYPDLSAGTQKNSGKIIVTLAYGTDTATTNAITVGLTDTDFADIKAITDQLSAVENPGTSTAITCSSAGTEGVAAGLKAATDAFDAITDKKGTSIAAEADASSSASGNSHTVKVAISKNGKSALITVTVTCDQSH